MKQGGREKKSVTVIYQDGTTKTYDSITEAAKHEGFSKPWISRLCHNCDRLLGAGTQNIRFQFTDATPVDKTTHKVRHRANRASDKTVLQAVQEYHYKTLIGEHISPTSICEKYHIGKTFAKYIERILEEGVNLENIRKYRAMQAEEKHDYFTKKKQQVKTAITKAAAATVQVVEEEYLRCIISNISGITKEMRIMQEEISMYASVAEAIVKITEEKIKSQSN